MQLKPCFHIARNVHKPRKINRTIDDVINHIYSVVEKETGITKFQLKCNSRKREIAYANKIASYLMYYYTPWGTKRVGLELGGRDHSTILSRIQTLLDLTTLDKVYKEQFRKCEASVAAIQNKFNKKLD